MTYSESSKSVCTTPVPTSSLQAHPASTAHVAVSSRGNSVSSNARLPFIEPKSPLPAPFTPVGGFVDGWSHAYQQRQHSDNPATMQVVELCKRCRREMQHYYQTGTSESRYSFELFRRALSERDEVAWNGIIENYNGLVKKWVLNHSKYASSGEEVDYFVNRAFERLWRYIACKPGKFAQFTELAAVLQYLKLCVHASITDDAPSLSVSTVSLENDDGRPADEVFDGSGSVEEPALNLEHNELWQTIDRYLNNEIERIVFIGFFVEGLKNRELLELYPDLFDDAKQISNKRTAILRRLSRNEEFVEVLQEFFYADRDRGGRLVC